MNNRPGQSADAFTLRLPNGVRDHIERAAETARCLKDAREFGADGQVRSDSQPGIPLLVGRERPDDPGAPPRRHDEPSAGLAAG